MTDNTLPQPFSPPAWQSAPAPVPALPPEADAFERSPWLARLADGDTLLASARRSGVGLALCIPFVLAAGLRTSASPVAAIVAGLGVPVGLALIALVGVAASTLGVSLTSASLSPTEAASIASRGLFRVGALLAGLAPLTALWVAGGRFVEMLIAPSLVIGIAGLSGVTAIARGLVVATALPSGEWRLGAMLVAILFMGFAVIVGFRLWVGCGMVLLMPEFEA